MADDKLTRREFMQASAAGAALAAAGGAADGAKPDPKKIRSYNEKMEYRRLGKTGLWVSAVCLGGHYHVGQMMKGYSEKIGKNRHEIISRCIDVGINYVDSCTEGEVVHYGPALKGRREKMYMALDMWPRCPRDRKYRTAEALLKLLDEGLKKATVEYVDLWRLVASTPGKHTEPEELEMVKALETARKQGKCRFTGVSSHGRPWLKRLCETYPDTMQVVLFPFTAKSKERPKDSLFDALKKHDVGSFGIKPFGGGSLFRGVRAKGQQRAKECAKLARLTIRHILATDAITAPIPGLYTVEQVDNMALAIKEGRTLGAADRRQLQGATAKMWANLPPQYQWLKDWEYV